ncbi:alpha/beta fold hydrolase [Streptosporangium sp. NPDC000396]|uniref:alpha/beta fold hydrolase n=1 Tax=Streptosporangium sp. NPDC000396 TaxID=3366185 RepID=UPI0036D04A25
MSAKIESGILAGGLHYLAVGEGRPVVLSPAAGPSNTNPHGVQLRFEAKWLASLARGFRIWRINRPVGMPENTEAAEVAAVYAETLRATFGEAVDLIGMSTGGEIAMQLAADHPALVRRLVLIATGHRISPVAAEAIRRSADLASNGRFRAAQQAMIPAITSSPGKRRLLRLIMGVAGPKDGADPGDHLATAHLDLSFDFGGRLKEIKAPTLVIAGERDPSYPPDITRELAAGIPGARLITYPADHGIRDEFAADMSAFLTLP